MSRFDKTEPINIEDIEINQQELLAKKELLEDIQNNNNLTNAEVNTESIEDIVKNEHQDKTIVTNSINLNTIGIASDHRGFRKKQKLTKYLKKIGYNVIDYGGDGIKGDDYTEYGFKLGKAINNGEIQKGIAICGSGIGISIACNKVSNARCAKVNNTKEAKWARRDNDANIIALSAKMPTYRAKDIIDVFLKTDFSNLERHQRRINMLNNYK